MDDLRSKEVMASINDSIKSLVEHQKSIRKRLDFISTDQNEKTMEKIEQFRREMEEVRSRMTDIEKANKASEDRWSKVFHFLYQAITTMALVYLLYKLNLSQQFQISIP